MKGFRLNMNKIIYRLENHNERLIDQADAIVKRSMTRLFGNNVHLISAETEVDTVEQLHWLANTMRHDCNRVVVLTMQSEFSHLVIAKSNNISCLDVNEILGQLIKDYGGQFSGNSSMAYATFYKQDIVSEIIDRAVESIIVALP